MYLFLNHPDVFLSAGSTSGVLNLRHSGFKKTTIAYLLGPYSEENKAFDEYSPVNLLDKIKDLKKTLIFDCGRYWSKSIHAHFRFFQQLAHGKESI
ncbi:hypothetical protein D3C86_1720290 [compost metagenome]